MLALAPLAASAAAAEEQRFAWFLGNRTPDNRRALVPNSLGPSTRTEVAMAGSGPVGSIAVDTRTRQLFLVVAPGRALGYRIGVGRDGFGWSGTVRVGAKSEWPEWRPPAEMRRRDPGLPAYVPPGPLNPLGARALYLHRDGRDTLYRIHGTNDPSTIGTAGSAGCFRMTNTDVIDLFDRVSVGARVTVS
ncbi:L,D-transpeptidase [Aurantimonas sp. HBX-1]|uniref:L,D-transpeptidase n=1 Tax=Aurantimonas sp. HBX-1 TaxID=2906072 RepID=UPI001F41909D|nr:L,D-transpeptidase [Aurantimonas sp. HBX-1]UIJ70491.1 L,D-transpeptidase [Aurantimonas sp. HBX-1]